MLLNLFFSYIIIFYLFFNNYHLSILFIMAQGNMSLRYMIFRSMGSCHSSIEWVWVWLLNVTCKKTTSLKPNSNSVTLAEERGLNSFPGNQTYNLSDFCASEVLDNHKSVLTSFRIETNVDELDLPYIYWIQKMHKIHINTDSLSVYPSVPTSCLYPFFSQHCLYISEVLRNSLLKKWDQSDVEFQGVIRTFFI